jgi:branched-chain amino acid transport system permease protein
MSTNLRVYGTYWWALALAVIATAGPYLILRSRTGLALKSMRDNDQAAKSCGVNIWRIKLYTFLIAGAGSAAAGAITAIHVLRVQPGAMFSIQWMAYIIFIGVIGGVGVIEGPIIGTVIYFVLRETTSKYGEWYFIILGLVAIVVVIWSPNGVYGYIYKKTRFLVFPLQRKLSLRTEAPGVVALGAEGGKGSRQGDH